MRMMFGIESAFLVCLAAAGGHAVLDAAGPRSGETLYLRLHTRLSSRAASAGLPFLASVVRPLLLSGGVAVPTGTRVDGTVTAVSGVGLGLKHERARIALEFQRLVFPDGTEVPLEASLAGVDNAREVIDASGRIRGIRATHELAERMNVRLGGMRFLRMPVAYRSLVAAYPLELLPLWFANALIFGLTDPEIDLPPGAEFRVRLRSPWPHTARFPLYLGERPERLSADHEAALAELVESQPAISRFEKTGLEGDPVNVVLLGSPAAAFRAAGWLGADTRTRRSCFRAVRAIATSSPYAKGPMNTLLLDGLAPQAEWQKGLNTYTKRHHLRAWGSRDLWEGDPVWFVAATHDTGLVVRGGALTHAIDHFIDREREKVVADLLLTGCVDAVTYVSRPLAGRHAWQTDGRVAVVRLNDCATPNRWDVGLEPTAGQSSPRSVPWRLLQRVTLNARNTLLRENHAYRVYDGVRHLILWRRLSRPLAAEPEDEASVTLVRAMMLSKAPPSAAIPIAALTGGTP